jgi:hypothetical protein
MIKMASSDCCNNAARFNLQSVEFAEVKLVPFQDKCRVLRLQVPRHPREWQVHVAPASLVALRTPAMPMMRDLLRQRLSHRGFVSPATVSYRSYDPKLATPQQKRNEAEGCPFERDVVAGTMLRE